MCPSRTLRNEAVQIRQARTSRAFTLLELVIAVTLLAVFLLPMMLIISKAKMRAIKYTQQRQVRDLAQRKLFDVIHYRELQSSGDFSDEGHAEWTWYVDPPQPIGSKDPILLEHTIHIQTPQKLDRGSENNSSNPGLLESLDINGDMGHDDMTNAMGSHIQLKVWAFPDVQWYEEQEILYEQGQPSILYGDPMYSEEMLRY